MILDKKDFGDWRLWFYWFSFYKYESLKENVKILNLDNYPIHLII